MGNTVDIIQSNDDTAQIDISTKNVRFLEGRFQAVSIYQRGGLQAFKVQERNSPKFCSLKIMPSLNTSCIRSILGELGEVSKGLEHPSLTKTLEVHAEASGGNMQILFIEEFSAGGSLKYIREKLSHQGARLDAMGIDKLELMRIAIDLLDGLAYLHSKDLYHGNVRLETAVLTKRHDLPHAVLVDLKYHRHIYAINQAYFGKNQCSGNPNYLPPEISEDDFVRDKELAKMQKGDIWSLGVLLLECWLFFNQSEGSESPQLNGFDLRSLSGEDRDELIKKLVKDEAVCDLVRKMLSSAQERPTAEGLLAEPVVKLYRYFLHDNEKDLADVVSNPAACVPYISGLTLINRSKAIVCMLGLMNLYKSCPARVLEEIEKAEAYIPMIEILTICLKDKDNDFISLHENALQILSQILSRPGNAEIKSKCIVGGLVALVINSIEKDSLNQGVIFDLLSSCAHGTSGTILQIAEKCGVAKKAVGLLRTGLRERAHRFLGTVGQMLSPAEILALHTALPPTLYLDVLRRLPMSKRTPLLSLDFLKTSIGILFDCKDFSGDFSEKVSRTIISLLCHRDTMLSCQVHSVCTKSAGIVLADNTTYECGYLCSTCGLTAPTPVCIICAHRCHQGHVLQPLGVQEFECRCGECGACGATTPLPLPIHVKLHDKFAACPDMLFRYDQGVLKEESKDVTYVSKECCTGTLIGARPLCNVSTESTEESSDHSLTIGYYEVEVLLGGTYDQIAVGLTNDESYPLDEFAGYKEVSIAFHGDDGKCYINGQPITYGCRFGSYDVIGCGITQNGDVYFTYNGMLFPLINLQLEGFIYPLVSLRGKFTSVRINMGPSFGFDHARLLELPSPATTLIANAELTQYLLDNPAVNDKISALAYSKFLQPSTGAALRAILGGEDATRPKTRGMYFHKQQNSLFSTKISNPEENKADAALRQPDLQHAHFNPPTGPITERAAKPDRCKGGNESEVYEEFTNANTHNDLKPFETAGKPDQGDRGSSKDERKVSNPGITSPRQTLTKPNVERIGDLPPINNSKRNDRKTADGNGGKRCACGAGGSNCTIF